MWIEAIVLRQDLLALARQMSPVQIRLGDDGRLDLSDPSEVVLVEGVGLRFTCEAKLHWSFLGISIPISIHALTVVVEPQVEVQEGAECVVFALRIEHADVAGLPTIIDERITDLVNQELAAKRIELAWPYGATLDHEFMLPSDLRPLEALKLQAVEARVKVTGDAFGLAIRFRATAARVGDTPGLAAE